MSLTTRISRPSTEAKIDPAKIVGFTAIASVEAVSSEWKLHPDLANGIIQPWSIVGEHLVPRFDADKAAPGQRPRFEFESDIAVCVSFYDDVDIDTEGADAIRALGGEIRSLVRSINMIVAHIPASRIEKLSDVDAVMYIEPPLPKFSGLNAENRVLTNVDAVNAAPYGLSGAGINVLIYDGGQVLATHQAFINTPIIGLSDTSGVSDHSTHVAGTVAAGDTGLPGIDATERGMAPNAQIVTYGFETAGPLQQGFLYTDPGDIEDDYTEALTLYGVDIANNSIGTTPPPTATPANGKATTTPPLSSSTRSSEARSDHHSGLSGPTATNAAADAAARPTTQRLPPRVQKTTSPSAPSIPIPTSIRTSPVGDRPTTTA